MRTCLSDLISVRQQTGRVSHGPAKASILLLSYISRHPSGDKIKSDNCRDPLETLRSADNWTVLHKQRTNAIVTSHIIALCLTLRIH